MNVRFKSFGKPFPTYPSYAFSLEIVSKTGAELCVSFAKQTSTFAANSSLTSPFWKCAKTKIRQIS